MNEKFYALPKEKQDRILNAGFRVFSKNTYKKSPMLEIANEADISKSLLFFYFKNKKELFLFLMKKAEEITMQHLVASGCYQESDIFEMMYKGLLAKAELMKMYPDMSNFALKAYYEDDEEVKDELLKIIAPYKSINTNKAIPKLDPEEYKEGLDLELMYQDMYLASEGYIYQMQHQGDIDVDKVVNDYRRIIDFWKKLYKRLPNKIVLANEDDREEIISLYKAQIGRKYCPWTSDYPGNDTIDYDLSRNALYVMKEDGRIIAAISIEEDEEVDQLKCWNKNIEPAGELARLAVLPDKQNRGIAKKMLNFGLNVLKEKGYNSVHFLVNKHNEKAIHSYADMEFMVVGECHLFEQDFLCYEKEL